MKLVSACLMGIKCRYDGKCKPCQKVIELSKNEVLIPICPEQLGGQSTPRPSAETTGDGSAVINGKARVIQKDGTDITESFIHGAKEVLMIANCTTLKKRY